MKLSISKGNSKIGKTLSVSLPPLITCPVDSPCMKDCYANKHAYRLYKGTRVAWNNNLKLWQQDPEEYEWQLRQYLLDKKPVYFRWHVSGDIPDFAYAEMIEEIAHVFRQVSFLIYTRRPWLDDVSYPNLAVLRSQWIGEQVDTSLRKFIVLPKGAEVPLDGLLCPGKCDENCRSCWRKVTNRPIYIHKH